MTHADGTVDVAEGGAFMAPVLLTWENADAVELHTVEAFGPVASVVGYDDAAHAVRLAAMGEGSLVATVCSADSGVVGTLVAGIVPGLRATRVAPIMALRDADPRDPTRWAPYIHAGA